MLIFSQRVGLAEMVCMPAHWQTAKMSLVGVGGADWLKCWLSYAIRECYGFA